MTFDLFERQVQPRTKNWNYAAISGVRDALADQFQVKKPAGMGSSSTSPNVRPTSAKSSTTSN